MLDRLISIAASASQPNAWDLLDICLGFLDILEIFYTSKGNCQLLQARHQLPVGVFAASPMIHRGWCDSGVKKLSIPGGRAGVYTT